LIAIALKDFTIWTTTKGVKNTINVEETHYGSGQEQGKKVFQIAVRKKEAQVRYSIAILRAKGSYPLNQSAHFHRLN
jgi:hypothetical protein